MLVKVRPGDTGDSMTARLRLPPAVVQKSAIGIDDPVMLLPASEITSKPCYDTGKEGTKSAVNKEETNSREYPLYLCKAAVNPPHKWSTEAMEVPEVFIDPMATICSGNPRKQHWLNILSKHCQFTTDMEHKLDIDTYFLLHLGRQAKVPVAALVEIRVNSNTDETWSKEHVGPIRNILEEIYVAKGVTLSLEGFPDAVVERTQPEAPICRVDPFTRLEILDEKERPVLGSSEQDLTSETQTRLQTQHLEHPRGLPRLCTAYETAHALLRNAILTKLLCPQYSSRFKLSLPKGILLSASNLEDCDILVQAMKDDINHFISCRCVTVLPEDLLETSTGKKQLDLYDLFRRCKSGPDFVILYFKNLPEWCPHREGGGGWHQSNSYDEDSSIKLRKMAQLLTLMDSMRTDSEPEHEKLLIIASSDSFQKVDSALRRPGRFEHEISLEDPDAGARFRKLHELLSQHELSSSLSNCIRYISSNMPTLNCDQVSLGDVNDVREWTRKYLIAFYSVKHIQLEATPEQELDRFIALIQKLTGCSITMLQNIMGDAVINSFNQNRNEIHVEDLLTTSPRNGVKHMDEFKPVTWDSIGGIPEAKSRLKEAIEWPLRYGSYFQKLNLTPPKGVLLFGPPGCSKTMLVRAAATALKTTFISLSGADIMSPYVGEAERQLRDYFQQARQAQPAILFIDEIESLVGSRHGSADGSGGATSGVLTTLLTEMDGVTSTGNIILVGATNMPENLDAALLRPGRFDIRLLIPPPDEEGRLEILKIYTQSLPLCSDVNLNGIACRTKWFSGAELEAICREASLSALRRAVNHEEPIIYAEDFECALRHVRAICMRESSSMPYHQIPTSKPLAPEPNPMSTEVQRLQKFQSSFTNRL